MYKTQFSEVRIVYYVLLGCMLGYSGQNCTIKCPYPTFGDECQRYCDCETTLVIYLQNA